MVNASSVVSSAPLAIASYCMSSILMTVTNKVVLSSYDFKLNFLLLGIQSILCVLTLQLFVKFNMANHRKFNLADARAWFIVSFALVAMIYTGSKALQYLPIPLFTIFKNITIIIIAYSEEAFFHGSPVTRLMLLSFTLMVCSSIIAGWADLSSGSLQKKSEDIGYFVSYSWMIANCLTTATFALTMKAKIKDVGFKDFDTVFFNNLISIPILAFAFLATETSKVMPLYERYFSSTSTESGFGLLLGIFISGVSSFGISYSTAWCMRVTSSTTYSMVGALNKLPIAVAGWIFFSDPVSFGGVLGVAIAFVAGIVYSHAKNVQKKAAAALPKADYLPVPTKGVKT